MNDFAQGGGNLGGVGGASIADVLTVLKGINTQLGNLISAINVIFPRITGTLAFGAAATVTVTEPGVTAASRIILAPINASAATLVGSAKSPYVSSQTPGIGFVVSTASGGNAAGGEQFFYYIIRTV